MAKKGKRRQMTRRIFLGKYLSKIIAFLSAAMAGLFITRNKPKIVAAGQNQKKLPLKRTNPYEYNIDPLKKVDPKLITYKETDRIKLNFSKAYAITVDEKDNIFVSGDKKVISFNNNGSALSTIQTENNVLCLAAGSDDRLYFGMKEHIEIYNRDGSKINDFHGLGESAYITSIAVGKNDIFVADAGNRVVWRFNKSGALLGKIGERNKTKGIIGLIVPSPYLDVAIASDANVWVANPGMHSLEKYTPDGVQLEFWKRISMQIDGFCGCCNPIHFCLMPDGAFVTSEKGIVRIKIHEPNGDLRTVVADPSQFADDTVGLDLAVNSKGQIWVLDPKSNAVRVYEKKLNSMNNDQ